MKTLQIHHEDIYRNMKSAYIHKISNLPFILLPDFLFPRDNDSPIWLSHFGLRSGLYRGTSLFPTKIRPKHVFKIQVLMDFILREILE